MEKKARGGSRKPLTENDLSALVGRVVGRLTVLSRNPCHPRGPTYTTYQCQCACGKMTLKDYRGLKYKRAKSCGCLQSEVAREKMSAVLAKRRRNVG